MGRRSRALAAGERRVGPGRLTHGWNGPQGTLLRLARPGEAEDVARLAETTGGPLDEWMHAAIEAGTASAALFAALRSSNEALIGPVSRCAATGDPTPFTELSLALVAERDQSIVGALPPRWVHRRNHQSGNRDTSRDGRRGVCDQDQGGCSRFR
jgi:hypothetical protein